MPSYRRSVIFNYTSPMCLALVSATCSDETGTIFSPVYEYYIQLYLFTPAGGYASPSSYVKPLSMTIRLPIITKQLCVSLCLYDYP